MASAAVWLLSDLLAGQGLGSGGAGRAADAGEPDSGRAETAFAAEPEPEPAKRTIVDFRMLDLDTGWYRYDDGTFMVTEDGGVTWREAVPDWTIPEEGAEESAGGASPDGNFPAEDETGANETGAGAANTDALNADTSNADEAGAASNADAANGADADEQAEFLAALREIEAAHLDFDASLPIVIEGKTIAAKRVQPVSGRIGWALADGSGGLDNPLLVSVDGGLTWHREMTAEVRAAIEAERERRRLRAEEAALYASPQDVMKPGPGVVLLPNVTYPGDVILARSGEPGKWNGRGRRTN